MNWPTIQDGDHLQKFIENDHMGKGNELILNLVKSNLQEMKRLDTKMLKPL